MPYIRLPDNSYYPIVEGKTPQEAMDAARSKYPKAFMEAGELESKQGFMPAAGEAFKEFKTKSLMGLGELTGNATLQKMAQEASEADEKAKQEGKHGFLPTEEEDIEAARQKGLMPLAGAYARKYISEPLGGIAGRYGAPMAAGAGAAGLAALAAPGAVATGAGALGAGLLAKGVTSLTDLPAEIGENVQRQIDVGAPIDSTKATAYGLAQAALAGFGIPGMGKLAAPVQKLFGKEANALAADVVAGTLTKDQALAKLSGTLKNVITGTGSAAVTGAGLMVGTEAARRASAGQDVTGPEALEEYKQNLIGAAELAPLFGVLHGVPKRGKDKKLIDRASQKYEVTKGAEERARKDAEAAALADEQARTQEAEGYNRAVMDTFGAPERPAEGVQGRTGDLFGGTYAAPEGALPPQRALNDNLLPRERERAVQEQFVESNSPQEVMRQERNLKQYVTGLRDQVSAAAAKADIKTLGELTPKLKEVEAAYAAAYKEYSALDIPEVKFEQITDQIEAKTKQLQKAGGAQGDFAKIEKLTNDIQKLQAELEKVKPPSGPDLFAVEKEVVAKGKAEAAEALAQGQQDFLAQVGKPETRIDARQRQTLERYNDNVRQLDEAYAANADKRIIDKLVDSVQADAAERAAIMAKTSDVVSAEKIAAQQQRVERITRAIAEAETKGDTASVAGLRNQLAKAIVETARPDAPTKRNRALEDQQAAIEELRSQVEDLKAKRYLGEGARDMTTAASMKAGLERKANETIGRYVEAAIRDVNAVREQNNVKKLTQTEAIRLAMDVRGHLENAVRNLNVSALRMPKESTVSTLEKQLAQIKRKHHKGEYVGPKRAEEFALRPEFDTLRAQQEQGKKVEGGTPFETEARKTERLAEEEKERVAKERMAHDVGHVAQNELFKPKELQTVFKEQEPGVAANVRATPENFMRLLRSGTVSNLRAKMVALRKPAEAIKVTKNKPFVYDSSLKRVIAQQERFALEVKNTHAALEGLKKDIVATQEAADKLKTYIESSVPDKSIWPIESALQHEVAIDPARKQHKKLLASVAEKTKALEAFRKEYAEHLDSSVAFERAMLKDFQKKFEKMEAGTPEQRKLKQEADASRARAAVVEREAKENAQAAAIEKQKAEQARLEASAQASEMSVRNEVVTTKYKVTDPKQLKQLKQYKAKLADELAKKEVDPAVVEDLQKKISQIAPDEPVLRTKITNPIPFNKSETLKDYASPRTANETRAERAEKKLAQQAQEREDVIARGESQRQEKENRVSLQDARKRESELNTQLKSVQKELGKVTKEKASLEKAITNAKTEKGKTHWQTKLDAFVKEHSIEDLLKREQVLKSGLEQVKDIGVKAERALVVLGNKAGRETTTKVKGVEKTAEEKELARIRAAHERAIAKSFEAYLEAEAPSRRGNITQAEYRGPSGTDFRIVKPTEQRLDSDQSKRVTDVIEKNLPKDIKVKSVDSFAELPKDVKDIIARDGIVEGSVHADTVRGFVTPNGDVYVVRNNHATVKDLETTYVHEIIGHAGVDRLLGHEGMRELAKRIEAQGGAMELAKKLGVEKEVEGALNDYAMSIQKLTDAKAPTEQIKKAIADMETQAVRELIAYTAEKRIDETFKQKAGRWLKELVGAVRAALRKMGFAELAEVSTADIYHILRQSQRNFNRGEMGAYREPSGQVAYRNKAVYAEGFDAGMAASTNKVIAQQKGFRDRIQGSVSGMSMMTRFADRFAPLEYIARTMKDKLEGVQMMYNNRLYDQRNNMLAEIATHGSVGYTKSSDGSYQYKSRGGPSLKDVFESAAKSKDKVGNGQATTDFFGMYIAMERAASDKRGLEEGLNKLSLDGKVSIAEANRILDFGRNDKNFQEARKQYREYNNGLLDLMVETGRLSKEEAAALKNGDYVPYYRENAKGELWDTEHNIKVGDLKTQAYLKELMGGDSAIVNFETGALQNTYMLTDMAMSNIATKNTAYTLNKLGIAEIRPSKGSAAPNVLRFYENGKEMHAIIETKGAYVGMEAKLDKLREAGKANTPEYKTLREKAEASRLSESIYGDIPAELIVKGMEGVATSTPLAVAMMRGPANLLRKAVTRNPVYAARVALKDSISGWITSGADVKPVIGVLGNLKKSWKGGSPEVRSLQEQGIIGGHVFAGTMSDMRTIAQQIAQGKTGWEKLWAKADRLAITADEASRVTLYNGFIKKGMSPMEATLATLESQNFTKHGYSPSMRMLSTMIPFFNAQVTGLNTFISNLSGKSLFEDKLGVKANMLKRGAILAGSTMIYSALMQNTEAYKNATEQDKLNYWFIPLPFFDEPVRVPIPFESGTLFKAIPEALFNLSTTDAKAKDVLPAVAKLVLGTVPGMSNMGLPQGIKPIIEAATNTNLFTMKPIESERQLAREAGHRANTNTTEAAKLFGEALGVSPIMLDHFVNAYTGSAGIALLSMFNPALRDVGTPESKSSQLPLIGGFFQPTDGSGLIDKAYNDMAQIEKINRTFKDYEEQNPEKAEQYLQKNLQQIDLASAAGKFKKDMGELNKEERLIQSDRQMTREQKRKELDEIKQMKIELAKEFMTISRE